MKPRGCECGHKMVLGPYERRTTVGAHVVVDKLVQAYVCEDDCGHMEMTMTEWMAHEKRVARAVLLRVNLPDLGSIRFARKALGMTQKMLAEEFDIASETVSRWENGALPLPRVYRIALAGMLVEEDDTESVFLVNSSPAPPSEG